MTHNTGRMGNTICETENPPMPGLPGVQYRLSVPLFRTERYDICQWTPGPTIGSVRMETRWLTKAAAGELENAAHGKAGDELRQVFESFWSHARSYEHRTRTHK